MELTPPLTRDFKLAHDEATAVGAAVGDVGAGVGAGVNAGVGAGVGASVGKYVCPAVGGAFVVFVFQAVPWSPASVHSVAHGPLADTLLIASVSEPVVAPCML